MNQQMFLNNFRNFVQNFHQNNQNASPQQIVQQMLNDGRMTQEQFNRCRDMANRLLGTNN